MYSPEEALERARDALASGQTGLALQLFSRTIDLALTSNNEALLSAASEPLERLWDFAPAWRALSAISLICAKDGPPEWDGTPLRGKTIVVEQRIRHIGAVIRLCRLIPVLSEQTDRCIVRIEPKLIALFARSFPKVEFQDSTTQSGEAYAVADFRTSYETACLHLIPDARSVRQSFVPLVADRSVASELRERYGSGLDASERLIGISWQSFNPQKELLDEQAWADLLRQVPKARFVSIQYGEAEASARRMAQMSQREIIFDPQVDQLTDMDLFAAQLASLDGVLSISNTGCHLAGALGIPTTLLIDSNSPPAWNPQVSQQIWYPSVHSVYAETSPDAQFIESVADMTNRVIAAR